MDVCVVHLVWAPLGRDPLRRFAESYRTHRAGTEHRLLVVYNGVAAGEDIDAWERELGGIAHEVLRLREPVLDLDAYRQAAENMPADYYCFLNSYSVLLADEWLALIVDVARQPGVGLVGASGSWASMRSLARYDLGLGGPYREVFESRREVRAQLGLLSEAGRDSTRFRGHRSSSKLRVAFRVLEQTRGFSGFPAPHLRTNGFLLARDTLFSMRWPRLQRKAQAHRLESGVDGLSAQAQERGLSVRVVTRTGVAFAPQDWHLSRTFWQGDQENLLIADNQTADYARGDLRMRRFLARYAWGTAADPAATVKMSAP